MLQAAGINRLRYPVPWHRIEHKPGTWDWQWMDGPLQFMRRAGLQPILDPLHHTSFPDWLQDGFANPAFPDLYCRFVVQVAERYEWADQYTVFNEPLPTLVLCALSGDWYPHRRSEPDFVRMAAHVARAIALGSASLRKLNSKVQLVQIDGCEHHVALDREAEPWATHCNHRRFLFHDLALGHVDETHPLLPYLLENGMLDAEWRSLRDAAVPFDFLGLDYYHHSEIDWAWDREHRRPVLHFPCREARGFAAVGAEYWDRYGIPLLLSETNLGGTVYDRITWLKLMEEQAGILAQKADFRAFCWFPSIDATDWWSLCTRAENRVSPMGIWSLDDHRETRYRSELSGWYAKLARGEAGPNDLPAYRFAPPLDRDLHGHLHLMSHWTNWQDQPA
jgi:hypothetical protein